MKYIRFLKSAIIFLSLGILAIFSSCSDAEHRSDPSQEMPPAIIMPDPEEEQAKADIDTENLEASEESQPEDLSSLQQAQESQKPQEDFYAQYIGKTVGDVVQGLGDDYITDYYEGSAMIGYPGNLWFLFGSAADTITDDLIIRQMIVSGQDPAVYGLAGSMTYPEIVEAVCEETEVPTPDFYYSLMDDDWEYTTGFTYRGYYLIYTWLEDPENALSTSVWVTKQDVDASKPNDQPANPEPPKEPDRDDLPEDEMELFCGPGWFEGVMGSRFYVPDGFVQQDFAPAVGHYYSFKNIDLDMSISVQEMTFMMLGVESSAMLDEYTSRAASDGVTYATSGGNFYVVSGCYSADENSTIYYNRVDYDDMFRYEVDFQYPTGQEEEGEKILLEFLKNYSCS